MGFRLLCGRAHDLSAYGGQLLAARAPADCDRTPGQLEAPWAPAGCPRARGGVRQAGGTSLCPLHPLASLQGCDCELSIPRAHDPVPEISSTNLLQPLTPSFNSDGGVHSSAVLWPTVSQYRNPTVQPPQPYNPNPTVYEVQHRNMTSTHLELDGEYLRTVEFPRLSPRQGLNIRPRAGTKAEMTL